MIVMTLTPTVRGSRPRPSGRLRLRQAAILSGGALGYKARIIA